MATHPRRCRNGFTAGPGRGSRADGRHPPYTSAPDAEGTLGGLVNLGQASELGPILQRAIERAGLCSSDPLCADHEPDAANSSIHGPATPASSSPRRAAPRPAPTASRSAPFRNELETIPKRSGNESGAAGPARRRWWSGAKLQAARPHSRTTRDNTMLNTPSHIVRRVRFGVRLAPALVLALAPLLGQAQTPVVHADGTCTTTGRQVKGVFGYTGAAQTWTVPPGITSGSFDAFGAQGGIGGGAFGGGQGPGGLGGKATATLPLTPGSSYPRGRRRCRGGGSQHPQPRCPTRRRGRFSRRQCRRRFLATPLAAGAIAVAAAVAAPRPSSTEPTLLSCCSKRVAAAVAVAKAAAVAVVAVTSAAAAVDRLAALAASAGRRPAGGAGGTAPACDVDLRGGTPGASGVSGAVQGRRWLGRLLWPNRRRQWRRLWRQHRRRGTGADSGSGVVAAVAAAGLDLASSFSRVSRRAMARWSSPTRCPTRVRRRPSSIAIRPRSPTRRQPVQLPRHGPGRQRPGLCLQSRQQPIWHVCVANQLQRPRQWSPHVQSARHRRGRATRDWTPPTRGRWTPPLPRPIQPRYRQPMPVTGIPPM